MKFPTTINFKNIHFSIIKIEVFGFLFLLLLIWAVGMIGQSKLEDLKIRAGEAADKFTYRHALANEIREAAAVVIAQARLYRAARDLGITTVPYRVNLNKAKYELGNALHNGEALWKTNVNGVPADEKAAWNKIELATARFWKLIEDEENRSIDVPQSAAGQAQPVEAGATPAPMPTPVINSTQETGRQFFQTRSDLELAATQMGEIINNGRANVLIEIEEVQRQAAVRVGTARWFTLLFGVVVAFFTIAMTRRQLNKTRMAERRFQEEQGRKGAVFDSLSNDIIVLNEQGEVLEVNQAFLEHFRLTNAELKLQDFRAALAQVPEIASFIGETIQSSEFEISQRERILVSSKNGQSTTSLFDVSVSPLRVGEETFGRVVVLDDVTDDERVREELRRSRTLSAVGQITAQVAHEIYNPLGAVKLNLELLEMQAGDDEDVKHTIGRLKRGLNHLSTIVMDLRYLTRPREPERRETDLTRLLDEVVELASDRLERSRTFIVRDYSPETPQGEYDPQQLRKAFLNLLINAVEASPKNGEVELKTRLLEPDEISNHEELKSGQSAILVSVIDHGIGMSEETKRHLFEAFYTTKRNGTGLGMMITQEIIKKHGGKIEVESEEGRGTTVNVYLPL